MGPKVAPAVLPNLDALVEEPWVKIYISVDIMVMWCISFKH